MPTRRDPLKASDDNIDMLRSVRTRLLDAFRDEDCPARELSALGRRLQEVGVEIAEYDGTAEAWRRYQTDLKMLRARIQAAVEDPTCPYRELSPLTRRLQAIVKELSSVGQKVQLTESRSSGRARIAPAAQGSFDPSAL